MGFLEAVVIVLCWNARLIQGQAPNAPPDPIPTDHTDRGQDGSYRFQYSNNDAGRHYQAAVASADNTVAGRYGYREPGTGRITETSYTAGQRGFRARGPDIARKMDLSQVKIPYSPPISPDSPAYQPSYDTYHDPNEDAIYDFNVRTPTYLKSESSGPRGDTTGQYSYIDDVGKRHDVQYEAGAGVGFHVRTPFPDSDPFGGLFYNGPNKPGTPLRGHTSIQRGKDGSYKFVSTGPDQKRTEISDASGRVRGSYTYIDDKGLQRTVDYIAGPGIGYKIINKGANPAFPTIYPFVPSYNYPLNFPDPKAPTAVGGIPPIFKPNAPLGNGSPNKLPSFEDDLFGKPLPGRDTNSKTATPISPTSPSKSDCENCFDVSNPSPVGGPTPSSNPFKPSLFDANPNFGVEKSPPQFPKYDKGPSFKPLYSPSVTTSGPPPHSGSGGFLGPDSSIHDTLNNDIGSKPFSPPVNSAFPEDDPERFTTPKYIPPSHWDEELFGPKSSTATPILSRGSSKFDPNNPNGGYDYNRPTQGPHFGEGPTEGLNSHDRTPYKDRGYDYNASKGHPGHPGHSDHRDEGYDDKFYGFPPGVAVRAHVQSLDILPYGRRVPPPGEAIEYSFERRSRENQRERNQNASNRSTPRNLVPRGKA